MRSITSRYSMIRRASDMDTRGPTRMFVRIRIAELPSGSEAGGIWEWPSYHDCRSFYYGTVRFKSVRMTGSSSG